MILSHGVVKQEAESMKRFLLLTAVMGLLSSLSATPGDTHKIDWCHFPPGQWTGDPATSKVLILSIDVAAGPIPTVPPAHGNHLGDGPFEGYDANGVAICGGAIG